MKEEGDSCDGLGFPKTPRQTKRLGSNTTGLLWPNILKPSSMSLPLHRADSTAA